MASEVEEEQRVREANIRAYDNLDKREARNDRKEKIAGKVIDKIKNIKKMLK